MIKLKQLLTERTLYHGTTIDAAKDIEKYGLIPQAGSFVTHAYGDYFDAGMGTPELVFAADKKNLQHAVTAATFQVGQKLGKDFHSVTDKDFFLHAAILKIFDGEQYFHHRPKDDDYRKEHPITVEPGDYYSEEGVGVDEVYTGNALIKLLKKNGMWPRGYGQDIMKMTDDDKRDYLVKTVLKTYPDKKDTILKKVMGLTPKDLDYWYEKYRRELDPRRKLSEGPEYMFGVSYHDYTCPGPFIIFRVQGRVRYAFGSRKDSEVHVEGEHPVKATLVDTHGRINEVLRSMFVGGYGDRVKGRVWLRNATLYAASWDDIDGLNTFGMKDYIEAVERLGRDELGVESHNIMFNPYIEDENEDENIVYSAKELIHSKGELINPLHHKFAQALHVMDPEMKSQLMKQFGGVLPKIRDIPDYMQRQVLGIDESVGSDRLKKLQKMRDKLFDIYRKATPEQQKRLEKKDREIRSEIEHIKETDPYESDKEAFFKHHYTGHIEPRAYDRYEKEGGLDWMGVKSKYPKLLDKGQYGPYEVEFRQTGEKSEYVKQDADGNIVRDERGNPTMMTPEEVRAANLPEEDDTIAAFVEDRPIGTASNEFGAVGVWVTKPFQKLGIGTDLLAKHMKVRHHMSSGRGKIGQMTPAGQSLVKKYYDKMAQKHGTGWFKKLQMKEGIEEKDAFAKQQEKKLEFDADWISSKVFAIKISATDDYTVGGNIELRSEYQEDVDDQIPAPNSGYLYVNYVRATPRGKGYGYMLYKQALKYAKLLGYRGLVSSKERSPFASAVWAKLPKTEDKYYDYMDTKALDILP